MTMSWDGRQSVFDHLGRHLSDADAAENTELVWTIIEKAMKLSNEASATISAEKSLYDFFKEQVVEMFPSKTTDHDDQEAKGKRAMILRMAEMWGAFVGSPIQRQSLKFFWLEECIDGENLFVAETYHKVLAKIAESALGATIKFGHVVKRVHSHEEGEGLGITVDVEGGASESYDEVVMTAPLGWLQRNADAFSPGLPENLRKSIDSISYGHLDKVSSLGCSSLASTYHLRSISISLRHFGTRLPRPVFDHKYRTILVYPT